MSHEFASGFFVGQPAWHKLGIVLNNAPSIDEAIKLAGLDWRVDLEPMFLLDGTEIDDNFAVIRASDRKQLGTVGAGFRTVQNGEAFERFQPLVDAGLVTLEAAGSLRGGKRVWILAKVKGPDAVIVPASGDTVANYLLLAHGHDGSLAIHAGITPTRVVCNNTLSAAVDGKTTLRIRHTKGASDALKAAFEIIGKASNQFEKAAEVYRALANVYVTAKQLHAYIDSVFPPPKKILEPLPPVAADDLGSLLARPVAPRDSVFSAENGELTKESRQRIYGEIDVLFERGRGNDMAGVKGTAWAAYNAVTEYITHERGRSDDNRVNAAWFGAESPRAITSAVDTFLRT